ncbi:MAG: AAA family ATPase [Fimbriimonas sp.]|nr:AAA family ATPase [Fimbriimonas sp.]
MPDLPKGRIFFISGAPGVGKSTTARALAARFERAFRIDLDYFRQYVVSGLRQPGQGYDEECHRQFCLAHKAAGQCAKTYSDAGFTVVVEHCSFPDTVELFVSEAGPTTVVCLACELNINLERNLLRNDKSFDPKDIEHFVHDLNAAIWPQFAERSWPVIHSGNQKVDDMVEQIMEIEKTVTVID